MRFDRTSLWITLIGVCCTLLGNGIARAADAPSPELAFSFRPIQKRVEYDTPPKSEYGKCQVNVEQSGKSSGWIVIGPAGQTLRKFVDTNADNIVDQWRYYHHGLEVYRDVDSNYNNKVDYSRWLNTGGSRWGLDKNEDGRIDEWKIISAPETAREAFEAIIAGDDRALATLCINSADIRTLRIKSTVAKTLLASVESPGTKLRKMVSGSKILSSKTRWMRFDGSTPSIIPAEDGKADQDLMVYENAMAIVEADGKSQLMQIGELVRVGEAWKLTQIPRPLEGNSIEVTLGGILMQPVIAAAGTPASVENISPEMQKLLKDLQKLDGNSPSPTDSVKALTRYNTQRADLLEKLVENSKTDADREQWTRQLVYGVAASVQTGGYPKGLDRLKRIEASVKKSAPKSKLEAYVTYRRLLAEYSLEVQAAKSEEQQKLQDKWLKDLEKFAAKYPDAEDTPEALLQLAIAEEFSGRLKQARKWYESLTVKHPDTPPGARAAGSLRRLNSKGKPFVISASSLKGQNISSSDYRGKVLLVLYWSTWCKPCTEDLPQIRDLYGRYRGKGFEILGVNLDMSLEPVDGYLKQHKVDWTHIHEPGGMESRLALEYGIISLPTMFLVGADGKVISRSTSVDDLKKTLPELLDKK